jgi:hypothetical protein
MLSPQNVAAKIVEMIFDAKTYKNGDAKTYTYWCIDRAPA